MTVEGLLLGNNGLLLLYDDGLGLEGGGRGGPKEVPLVCGVALVVGMRAVAAVVAAAPAAEGSVGESSIGGARHSTPSRILTMPALVGEKSERFAGSSLEWTVVGSGGTS